MSPNRSSRHSLTRAFLILAIFVVGCARLPGAIPPLDETETLPAQTATPAPTLEDPSPTVPAPTDMPSPTGTATPSATPLPVSPTTTATPFPITFEAPTPEPGPPEAEIQIQSPGPLSKLVSPFNVRALLAPGAGGRIRVDLNGEDGRLLVRKLLQFSASPGRKVLVLTELDFEISAVAETGRLSISVDDAAGRTTDLASVDLILLSTGVPDVNPAGDLLAPLVIEEPAAETTIEGGKLVVTGLARPASAQPLKIELIDGRNVIIGERLVAVAEGPAGEHRPFATEITYRVEETTPALLVVRERGERIPGTTQLVSIPIILTP